MLQLGRSFQPERQAQLELLFFKTFQILINTIFGRDK